MNCKLLLMCALSVWGHVDIFRYHQIKEWTLSVLHWFNHNWNIVQRLIKCLCTTLNNNNCPGVKLITARCSVLHFLRLFYISRGYTIEHETLRMAKAPWLRLGKTLCQEKHWENLRKSNRGLLLLQDRQQCNTSCAYRINQHSKFTIWTIRKTLLNLKYKESYNMGTCGGK